MAIQPIYGRQQEAAGVYGRQQEAAGVYGRQQEAAGIYGRQVAIFSPSSSAGASSSSSSSSGTGFIVSISPILTTIFFRWSPRSSFHRIHLHFIRFRSFTR